MPALLLLIFIAIPVIEIALFIEVGGWIGLWPTIAIVILTAFAGTSLLRLQGLAVLQRVQESAARNELPVAEVFDGLCLLVAGVLLLTPGFFTDTVGFLLFVPAFRRGIGMGLWTWLMKNGRVTVAGWRPGGGRGPGEGPGAGGPDRGAPGGGPVIDGEFEEVDEEGRRNSRWGDRNRDRIGPGDR